MEKARVAYILEEHVYFYQTRKAQRQLLQRQAAASHRIAAAHMESQLAAFETWTPLIGEEGVAPGVYWTKDLDHVRGSLLNSGRSPRITLKNGLQVSCLTHHCTKAKDGCIGKMTVKQVPKVVEELQAWLLDLSLKLMYRGERSAQHGTDSAAAPAHEKGACASDGRRKGRAARRIRA